MKILKGYSIFQAGEVHACLVDKVHAVLADFSKTNVYRLASPQQ